MTVELNDESLRLSRELAYWDGYAEGAAVAAGHMKERIIRQLCEQQKPPITPVTPINKEA